MILTYEAIDTEGRPTSDTLEASDVKDALQQLRRRGLFVTQVVETSGAVQTGSDPASRGRRSGLKTRLFTRKGQRRRVDDPTYGRSSQARIPLKTLALFTRQVAMLIRAGSGIVPAVAAIKRQTNKPGPATVLGKIISDLEEGMRLADALRKHPRTFSPVYCAVVAAGEASGTLAEMFERMAGIVGKQRAMHNKVIGALAYPVLLMAMSCNIFIALLFFVLPRFSDMFNQLGVNPPVTTRVLLVTGEVLATYWPVVIGSVVVLVAAIVRMLTSARGRQWLSDVQIRVPLLGSLRSRLIQGQIFRTMGTLLESGVGVLDTLELVRESTRNNRFQKLFADLEEVVTSGGRLSSAFEDSGLVEPYICQAIHTGEDSGCLGGSITYCADILDETNAELINTVTKLIEPLILIVMGVVVGTVAVSLFMPLFDLTSAMQ